MSIPKAIKVEEILKNNQAAHDDQLLSNVGGYEFSLIKDEECDCWYIRVCPEGESYLYDGWWSDSEDKSLEEAVIEALHGSEL